MEKPAALEHNPGHAGSSRRACGRRRAGGCVSGSGERRRDRSRGLGSAFRGERRREHPRAVRRASAGSSSCARWAGMGGRWPRARSSACSSRASRSTRSACSASGESCAGATRGLRRCAARRRCSRRRVTGPGGKRTATFPVRVRSVSGRPRFRAGRRGREPQAASRAALVVCRARDRCRGPSRRRNGGPPRPRRAAGSSTRSAGSASAARSTGRIAGRRGSAGGNALLQASVVGPGGTRTVGYSVRVR